jgi:hypothetical protein
MFFLYFNRKDATSPRRIDPQAVINRLMPCALPDKSGFLTDDENSLLVQCLHWNTARSRLEPTPLYHAESRTAAASWARLDNRAELAKDLDIATAELTGFCDTELILKSYLKWGEACVEQGLLRPGSHGGATALLLCLRRSVCLRHQCQRPAAG